MFMKLTWRQKTPAVKELLECGSSLPLFLALTCQRVRAHRNQLR
jgi:hypothetical protein